MRLRFFVPRRVPGLDPKAPLAVGYQASSEKTKDLPTVFPRGADLLVEGSLFPWGQAGNQ